MLFAASTTLENVNREEAFTNFVFDDHIGGSTEEQRPVRESKSLREQIFHVDDSTAWTISKVWFFRAGKRQNAVGFFLCLWCTTVSGERGSVVVFGS